VVSAPNGIPPRDGQCLILSARTAEGNGWAAPVADRPVRPARERCPRAAISATPSLRDPESSLQEDVTAPPDAPNQPGHQPRQLPDRRRRSGAWARGAR